MINQFSSLSSRAGFNRSLGHFRLVTTIVRELRSSNLAEIIDASDKVSKAQIGPLLNAVVVERMGYVAVSRNMRTRFSDFEALHQVVAKWNRLDIIVAYHQPQLGITLINPKIKKHWENVQEIAPDELMVVYAKAYDLKDAPLERAGVAALFSVLEGGNPTGLENLGGAPPRPMPASPKPAVASGKPAVANAKSAAPKPVAGAKPRTDAPRLGGARKKVIMTPKYSVQVTNELFHNGNVEAWKNIVESYKTKFPGLDVHIFHDGEKVNNINALFKWGKVKHGDVLLISISGEEIKGVAKLQRYLYEGASIRYETFIKVDVNKVLNLF